MMEETDFFKSLVLLYSKLDIPKKYEDICKLDKNISYYLADSNNQLIFSFHKNNKYVFELDIVSAFPTICRCMFSEDSEFVKSIYRITEKLARNIHIATTLKNSGYLEKLNMTCKMIIFSFILLLDYIENNIIIFELKKDGALVAINDTTFGIITDLITNKNINIENKNLQNIIEFILQKEIDFHYTNYKSYVRSAKTSLFINDNSDMIIKGMYKYFPIECESLAKKILLGDDIDLFAIKTIYTNKMLKIYIDSFLKDVLDKYYICSNGKFLNKFGKYSNHKDLDPIKYLQTFIYPALIASKNR